MFQISPINEKELQSEYANACGTSYKENFFAYSMIDQESGDLMGFSQFEINENGGLIVDLREKLGYIDNEAMFILGRATMNFIDLCSCHTCYAKKDAGSLELLHAIGFRETDGELLFCDMTGMFDGNCSGHH